MPAQTRLTRWRGFNLLEMFSVKSEGGFREEDFELIAELGFDFVRLPLCYLLWLEGREEDTAFRIHEPALEHIDRAVDWGRKLGVHVCINFHRAPGYSVSPEVKEKRYLWRGETAQQLFCRHWELFARRYRGIPAAALSFNLVNEPPHAAPESDDKVSWVMTRADHARVVKMAADAIHAVDPDRLVIADGVNYGNGPCPELSDLAPGVAQSCRAYWPTGISHWKASWFKGSDGWPPPTWPGASNYWGADTQGKGDGPWDRGRLEAHYAQWADLARRGVGVHCGEGGAWNRTPHGVAIAWLRDVLEILKSHNIGWALWNFRGGFGVLDSQRGDVEYEDWHGRKLDRKLLDLLIAS